jgi:hypothetical protein
MISADHLLALPEGISLAQIATLAATRFPNISLDDAGALALSPTVRLGGPHRWPDGSGLASGFPPGLPWVFQVVAPRDRGDPPFPGTSDPTGLSRAFPAGLPAGEEAQVVDFLLAAARRLGGAVWFDRGEVVLAPPADSAIDLTVYSHLWLDPDSALTIVRAVSAQFQLAVAAQPWAGPASPPPAGEAAHRAEGPSSSTALSDGGAGLSAARRAELHRRADAHDEAALRRPPVLERYALRADFGADGTVWLEVGGVDVPGALRDADWTRFGVVGYALSWDPADPADSLIEFPGPAQRARRLRAARELARLAAAIHAVTGVAILDADGFPRPVG